MKQYFFTSIENAERVFLVFLIIWIAVMMFTFIKALSFCKKSKDPISTQVNVGYGDRGSASGSSDSPVGAALRDALQITEVIGVFVFILEICVFVFLIVV